MGIIAFFFKVKLRISAKYHIKAAEYFFLDEGKLAFVSVVFYDLCLAYKNIINFLPGNSLYNESSRETFLCGYLKIEKKNTLKRILWCIFRREFGFKFIIFLQHERYSA